MNRAVFALVAILCLISLSSIAGLTRVVKADSGTITINPDGSITPSIAPIFTADNITYTLTSNINIIANPGANAGGIVIERGNIVLNGAGYTLSGSGSGNGIALENMGNVTINNTMITNFTTGIWLNSSSYNVLSDNYVTNNLDGIWLYSSSNNTLSSNIATANIDNGIDLSDSSDYNTLSDNKVVANNYGIWVELSNDNTLSGNNITSNNYEGIQLESSTGNTLSGNVMVGNGINFDVTANNLGEYFQSVDTSNLVNGKPVYYFVNQSDTVVNPDTYPEVGYLCFVNCKNVTVQGMNLTDNLQGLWLAYTTDSRINGNTFANNSIGIWLRRDCNNNVLTGNKVSANSNFGIFLDFSINCTLSGNIVKANSDYGIALNACLNCTLSSNNVTDNLCGIYLQVSRDNLIFDNNFVNNGNQTSIYVSSSVWDNGSMGNYWSDYLAKYPNATQVGSSGIWNTPYTIDTSNIDHYPLMAPIVVIPEFPSSLVLSLFMIATLLAVIIYKKKAVKQAKVR